MHMFYVIIIFARKAIIVLRFDRYRKGFVNWFLQSTKTAGESFFL